MGGENGGWEKRGETENGNGEKKTEGCFRLVQNVDKTLLHVMMRLASG